MSLAACQAVLTGAVLVAQTLGTIEARRLTASVAFAGSAISAQLVGAVGALLLVRRRPPAPEVVPALVATGFGGIAIGALACGFAVASDSLSGLLIGSTILGGGAAVALLLRTTAAGAFPPSSRARAVAFVAAGGVVGAVSAPLVVRFPPRLIAVDSAAHAAVPWVVVAAGAAIAALVARSVSAEPVWPSTAAQTGPVAPRRTRRAAMTACIVAGIGMVAIMSTATLQLHHLGAGDDRVATIVAVHYAAMFGFAVPFGLLADRAGRRLALMSAVTLVAASGLGLAADPHGQFAFALVLALVGAGWSGAFVTGTAMLADASGDAARAGLVARNDLVVAVTSSGAAFAATALFARGGPESVGAAVAALAIGAVVVAAALEGSAAG